MYSFSKVASKHHEFRTEDLKKHRNYALTLVLLALSTLMNAQLRSGYRFGINLTSMAIDAKGLASRPERPTGIQFGLNYDLPFNRHLFILSGFVFSSKGADYKIDTTGYSLAPSYVEIPVNIGIRTGSKTTRVSFFAGPYAACAIGGYEIISGNEFKYLNLGRTKNDDLKYFDFGFNTGVSVEIRSFVISAQYGTGLTNVSPANNIKMRNNVIGISITSLK
jgi:hypothetical protein